MAPVRLLILEPARRRYRLRVVNPALLGEDAGAGRWLLGGEALCQFLLREDPSALVIARGPMPFLSGNKTTVGYLSPLTGLPHYSFVGGRSFAELLNLGLDAIVLSGKGRGDETLLYVVISGRAPHVTVEWKSAAGLPAGQRSAFYALLQDELGGQTERGSILTVGEGARVGYRTANLAVDGLYHAGRGGAGGVFARFLQALVLRGDPLSWQDWLGPRAEVFWNLREGEIRQRLEQHTRRLSRQDGGTVTKLYDTGSGQRPTLPAHNAQRLGYPLADLGAGKILQAHRVGQTGCHWCQVNCRHWHWVDADYAPGGRDRFLDDFEPTYATFAMLDLQPAGQSLQDKLRLLEEVDRRVILPIEQMGCDVIDVGVALAALIEGIEKGLIPLEDVPPFLHGAHLGDLDLVAQAVDLLCAGEATRALRLVADGPQALAEQYPTLRDILFTSGPGTLANAGHANALWTFLMPFSRFFGHYVGQLYKIQDDLPSGADAEQLQQVSERVIRQALQREFFGCLGNALSTCAFTFVIFSQDGRGTALDDTNLLVRTLACYGIESRREELEWFAEAFWAQSIALKLECGWKPPTAWDLPARVFEAMSQALDRPVDELRRLMELLIGEWKRQAGEIMYKHGQNAPADWSKADTCLGD
jgi:aldehyde:ferredoxin oxidoreductase